MSSQKRPLVLVVDIDPKFLKSIDDQSGLTKMLSITARSLPGAVEVMDNKDHQL